MEIKLQKLELLNFKGIRKMSIDFSEKETKIYGDNATFKTTIADSFTWLLFGKNLQDQKLFSVKTLDENNQIIPKLNHEVQGTLLIDGETLVLKRILKENWIKKRGELEAKFTGNVENFFVDEVPFNSSEYKKKISSLIHEDQFKLITNPLYFNNVMSWEGRRTMLFKMAGSITYEDIAKTREEFQPLLDLIQQKSLIGYQKELALKRKNLNLHIKEIPSRIDEASRDMPEMPDGESINKRLIALQHELDGIDGNLEAISNTNSEKREKIQLLNNEILELRQKCMEIASKCGLEALNFNNEATKTLLNLESDKKIKLIRLKGLTVSIDDSADEIDNLNIKAQNLRNDIGEIQDRKADLSSIAIGCPVCKRNFPENEIKDEREKLLFEFNTHVADSIVGMQKKGIAIMNALKDIKKNRDKICTEKTGLEESLKNINKEILIEESKPKIKKRAEKLLAEHAENAEILQKIKRKEKEIQNLSMNSTDDIEAQERKSVIIASMDEFKLSLSRVEYINQKQDRIKRLTEEGQEYAQQIADLEKQEFLTKEFNKAYIAGIDEKISSIFPNVKFRMFKQQINEGEKDDCTLIYNGVPWDDLNTARKIQAGVEVINVISEHFGYQAPIFIDNSESIVKTPETEAQLIQLIVSAKDKELRIETV